MVIAATALVEIGWPRGEGDDLDGSRRGPTPGWPESSCKEGTMLLGKRSPLAMIVIATASGVGSDRSIMERGSYLRGQPHQNWPQKVTMMAKINLQNALASSDRSGINGGGSASLVVHHGVVTMEVVQRSEGGWSLSSGAPKVARELGFFSEK